jgi:hypothetical protein
MPGPPARLRFNGICHMPSVLPVRSSCRSGRQCGPLLGRVRLECAVASGPRRGGARRLRGVRARQRAPSWKGPSGQPASATGPALGDPAASAKGIVGSDCPFLPLSAGPPRPACCAPARSQPEWAAASGSAPRAPGCPRQQSAVSFPSQAGGTSAQEGENSDRRRCLCSPPRRAWGRPRALSGTVRRANSPGGW